MPKTHVLSTSRKHTTDSLVKSFREGVTNVVPARTM